MRVLLSIKPVHVENILLGTKTFEFRRRIFARKDVQTVMIYCTRPIGKLVGEFDIADILEDDPATLWQLTECGSGISKEYFDEYFKGRDQAFALKIGEVRQYKQHVAPSDLMANFTPPQSYMYVGGSRYERLSEHQLELF
jgi:predicted transcriptional regulator